jgi:hypothetical protein
MIEFTCSIATKGITGRTRGQLGGGSNAKRRDSTEITVLPERFLTLKKSSIEENPTINRNLFQMSIDLPTFFIMYPHFVLTISRSIESIYSDEIFNIPVIIAASSETRYEASPATSSGVANLPDSACCSYTNCKCRANLWKKQKSTLS